MATGRVQQDVAFTQSNATTYSLDLSKPAISLPKRVADYRSYSFTAVWAGSPVGALEAIISNAGEKADQLVGAANWVTIGPDAALSIGQGDAPDTSPSGISVLFNASGWAALRWTPSGGSGTMTVQFDGVRR